VNLSIDITRLEKVRRHGVKITARCPACAAEGGDKSGTHFFQSMETGKFGCAKYPGDAEHRREIFRLVGIKGERDPAADKEWKRNRMKEETAAIQRRKIENAVRAKRATIIASYPWTAADALLDSPQQDRDAMNDPRRFLASLFPADALVWTGEVDQSGQAGRYASRWKTTENWQQEKSHTVGAMVSPAIWKPGSTSRSADAVSAAPYEVLDFDGFDNIKPETPDQIRQHLAASMAIIRWLRERLNWQLAAILYSGNKSLHAWFHRPTQDAIDSLRNTASAFGVDAGLVGKPEHPCRLPGWKHGKTGKTSRVLWLQHPPTHRPPTCPPA